MITEFCQQTNNTKQGKSINQDQITVLSNQNFCLDDFLASPLAKSFCYFLAKNKVSRLLLKSQNFNNCDKILYYTKTVAYGLLNRQDIFMSLR